jgi:hypothetical protein
VLKPIKFHGGLLDKQAASVTDLSHWQPGLMRADYQGTGSDENKKEGALGDPQPKDHFRAISNDTRLGKIHFCLFDQAF